MISEFGVRRLRSSSPCPGYVDPELILLANCHIGNHFWARIFGDPKAVPRYMARIIKFPERRSEMAQIRDELAKLKRTPSVR